MNIDSDVLKKCWDLVSQFVCWEFCRNLKQFSRNSEDSEKDLVTFFRDMVIQMTLKEHESEITKFEVVAKFIEELTVAKNADQFRMAFQLAQSVKTICPELKIPLAMLMKYLEKQFIEEKLQEAAAEKDDDFCRAVEEFSTEALRLLPKPDLIKSYELLKQEEDCCQIIVNSTTVMERLKKEIVASDIPEIIEIIESGNVYQPATSHEDALNGSFGISSQQQSSQFNGDSTEENGEFEENESKSALNESHSEPESEEFFTMTEDIESDSLEVQTKSSDFRLDNCQVMLVDCLRDPNIAKYLDKRTLQNKNHADSKQEPEFFTSPETSSKRKYRKRNWLDNEGADNLWYSKRAARRYICQKCGVTNTSESQFSKHRCRI